MEEFLPSAETEGIWGFTNAIEMVGGVSLFIFFTVFKQSKKSKHQPPCQSLFLSVVIIENAHCRHTHTTNHLENY